MTRREQHQLRTLPSGPMQGKDAGSVSPYRGALLERRSAVPTNRPQTCERRQRTKRRGAACPRLATRLRRGWRA
eukprot:CAMPEP_0181206476 /NCGR_PEP_ID=MMETSP1096-20121128/21055_1 /TAXON_ID=156174 ORGANISM="Chrysochromulina ericina, Strain CCMP281" /NCGR_SAMPLE_ID=MMETSP1096 /ASSEMBLY_ACC=CAM_ASM_000453 /LENGTH=73 /DNA_ID=CAMNT_0023297377 /DNA_START=310 /DNA_END=527 /DNA_ORIENTATION=+